jgi:tetratricopeptide (TPR) repeat protein
MANIESAMTGENKMVLTVRPSALATSLRACQGISRVEIWTLAYRPYLERRSLSPRVVQAMAAEHQLFKSLLELEDSNEEFAKRLISQARAVDRRVSLIQGRLLHFRGQYENDGESRGARAYYLGCRKPATEIEAIINELREKEGFTEEQARYIQQAIERTKQNATFWLGLMAADRGEYSIAVDYLRKIQDGPWVPGAKYNLGRALEAIGLQTKNQADLESAKAAYQSDIDSPQAFQCRLRVRYLETIEAISDASPHDDGESG